MSPQVINILLTLSLVLFVPICALLLLVVLMQRSKQDGIGATFGSGFTDSVFGAQTSNVLVRATNVLLTAFFILSILIGHLYSRKALNNPINKSLLSAPAPAAAAPVVPEVPAAAAPTVPVAPSPTAKP
jgi:preprotein translocase subunit SecG